MNIEMRTLPYDPMMTSIESFGEKKNERVAEEMESLFINHLMQVMEKTTNREEDDMFYNGGEATYRSMLNQEMARELAAVDALGLKAMIMNDFGHEQTELKSEEIR